MTLTPNQAPIDTMLADETVLDLHRFDEIHLIAIRRLARILPDQPAAIGEEAITEVTAIAWCAIEHQTDKLAQLLSSGDDTLV